MLDRSFMKYRGGTLFDLTDGVVRIRVEVVVLAGSVITVFLFLRLWMWWYLSWLM